MFEKLKCQIVQALFKKSLRRSPGPQKIDQSIDVDNFQDPIEMAKFYDEGAPPVFGTIAVYSPTQSHLDCDRQPPI